jgi:threonine/homoserine/homoserine lactone efflux protein
MREAVMTEFASLLGIGVALFVGAASPGPSFVLVARTATGDGRTAGLVSALGMGFGGLCFAVMGLLGLHAALLAVPGLHIAFNVAGGAYLVYLGVRIWRRARHPLDVKTDVRLSSARSWRAHFTLGFVTQLSNPKSALVYASVFAAFMPAAPGLGYKFAVAALVFAVETGWYSVVAAVLSASAPRSVYLRCKLWVDRAAGAVLGALGIKLASSQVLS